MEVSAGISAVAVPAAAHWNLCKPASAVTDRRYSIGFSLSPGRQDPLFFLQSMLTGLNCTVIYLNETVD
jgi:hypothetical protein